ncbi:MAG: SoxR reducing system RseC family protein [FCB group bacterium]|nr:SoxR reducing system RseC family protein [FCB group bacterium]
MSTKGIIKDKKDGKIYIEVIQDKTACESCAARVFCSKSSCDENLMILDARPGFEAGDDVIVEESHNILLKTSLLAYGIPLIFFIGGILLGGLVPVQKIPSELIRFAFGCLGLFGGAAIGHMLAKRLSRNIDRYVSLILNNRQ